MATRVSSPRLIGRQAELDLLFAAFKVAANEERASTFLIGGEAGVGKSRLVSTLAAKVTDAGGLVASGGCIELGDRLPFGPVVQALRDLHRHLDPAIHAAVVGDAEPALARLLPELDQHRDDSGGTAALFEHLLGTLTRLGDRVPTLLVLEDLHWADHSTRDFLVFLARNLRDARVVVVATFRTDDMHRRHPLRPALAELERAGAATRIDLPRLDRDEIAELIAEIRGEAPLRALVDDTFTRSDGNAFFAEELLAAEPVCRDSMPDSLRDIVLARVDSLSDAAQHALRVVAVIGRSADYRLVTAVADVAEPELVDGLRDAVAHQVLVTDPDGLAYRFRHALVFEAVYEDLLPSERVRLHAAAAVQLEQRPEWFDGDRAALASELACHWNSAHDQRQALPASILAAAAAEKMYAYPEALAHIERALEMWGHVEGAAEITGRSHVALLREGAEYAHLCGRYERAVAYARAALDEVDPDAQPIEAALVHERLGRYLWQMNRPSAEYLAPNFEAVRLVPADPPSFERARVLATLAQQLMLAQRNSEAIETGWDAIRVAQEVGALVEEGHARNTVGSTLSNIGRFDESRAELIRAHEIALETSSWTDVARAATNLGSTYATTGEMEKALAITLEGAEEARRHGLDRSSAAFLRLNAAETLFELGRWDEMEEQIREADATELEGYDRIRSRLLWSQVHAGRGRYDEARQHLGIVDDAQLEPSKFTLESVLADARIRGWSGDIAGALASVRRHLGTPGETETTCVDAGPRLVALAASLAPDEETAAEFAAQFDEWNAVGRWGYDEPAEVPWLRAQTQAEMQRDDVDAWRAVAASWERAGMLPDLAYAQLRLARAIHVNGNAARAEEAVQAADALANRIGFAWIAEQTAAFAREAGLDLGEPIAPATPADRYGLTARERDVVRLLAAGRTNRQIGEELFISTKTASVHVSNILAKLHVANRGEAAAMARELELDT